MSPKKPSFNPDDVGRSYLIHEFLTLRKEFIQSPSIFSAKKLLSFFSDKKKHQLFIDQALFNPHPTTHDSVHYDIEETLLALQGWIDGSTPMDIVTPFLSDLKSWVTGF